mmetsp:Transcript_16165/g.41514  ORF Transcript_16165/g.41514 Transcript_16165/m.41514 type:complete len:625 (-) Transcript_16165:134-2008(-)
MEEIKGGTGDGTTHTRSNGLGSVTDKVRHREELLRVVQRLHIEMPIVGELQLQTSVVGGLDGEHIGHEIRTEHQAERGDGTLLLGLACAERNHCELLVRAEQDQIGTENHAAHLGLVVVHLHGRVVRGAVADHTSAIATLVILLALAVRCIAEGALAQEILDRIAELLLPEGLGGLQHVALAKDRTHLAAVSVAHVHAFVLVERDRVHVVEHLHLDRRHVVGRTADRPALSRLTVHRLGAKGIGEGLAGAQEQAGLLGQHLDVPYAALELLARLQEEADLTAAQLLLAQLRKTVLTHRVQHIAVLAAVQGGDVHLAHHTLVHVGDVGVGVVQSDQPLLAGAASHVADREGDQGLHVESHLLGEHASRDQLHHGLVDVRQIGTGCAHQPLVATLALLAGVIDALAHCAQLERLVLLDDGGRHRLQNGDTHLRHQRARAVEEVLLAGTQLFVADLNVTHGAQTNRCVRGHHLKCCDGTRELLTRVEREGLLVDLRGGHTGNRLLLLCETNLQIAVLETVVACLIQHHLTVLITHHRILNHTVVTWTDHNHLNRATYNLLMLLTCVGTRASQHTSDVRVVIQHVEIVERLEPEHMVVTRHDQGIEPEKREKLLTTTKPEEVDSSSSR